jgi:hypothetical protein
MKLFGDKIRKFNRPITLGQEPQCIKGRPNLDLPGTMVYGRNCKETYEANLTHPITGIVKKVTKQKDVDPRAFIHAGIGLDIWPLQNHCSRDIAVAGYDPKDSTHGRYLLISMYWSSKDKTLPAKIVAAVDFAEENGYTPLCCGDANAKSTLWNSKSTDSRGTLIEEFMLDNNLDTLNDGFKITRRPTERGGDGNIIDITMTNYDRKHNV